MENCSLPLPFLNTILKDTRDILQRKSQIVQFFVYLCFISYQQETYRELEHFTPRVQSLQDTGHALLRKSPGSAGESLKHSLHTLKTRWDNISSRATERKRKLDEAKNQAERFHEELNEFIAWLTKTEKSLNNVQPVSRVLDTVTDQVESHKVRHSSKICVFTDW